ncbi:hypothetical protein ACFY4C_16420 [Actinomadura viridis]|uniref:hypothetical protein n=1 Tax=Actinomadura viridis TaxID=58110 RepID=UPI00367D5CF6
MNTAEKKEIWRLLGQAIDTAAETDVPAPLFLTRLSLLLALELPTRDRFDDLVALALAAGRASAGDAAGT